MGAWIVLGVGATTLGLVAIATAVAVIDNRIRYGRWLPRGRGKRNDSIEPQTAADQLQDGDEVVRAIRNPR